MTDLVCGDRQGTRTGYLRHWRAGQPACQPCKDGAAAYQTGLSSYRERLEDKDAMRRYSIRQHVVDLVHDWHPSFLTDQEVILFVSERFHRVKVESVRRAIQRAIAADEIIRDSAGRLRKP